MSAISILPTNDVIVDESAKPEKHRETQSYTEAVAGYSDTYKSLVYLQRASARMVLDQLDKSYPPSSERSRVRQMLLDTLAWYTREVERWASSLQAESLTVPSDPSTD